MSFRPTRQPRTLILILFLLSGSAGLVYEIVWMKMLTLIIGNTIFATTTVLTSFMGGLALGSFLAGRFVDRRTDHLKVYGILEGAIGAYALVLPLLLGWTEPLFRFIYQDFHTSFYVFGLLRFLVCGFVLLIPTTMMGATLPVLSKYFVERQSQLGWTIGKLYGVNTFGAVAGALKRQIRLHAAPKETRIEKRERQPQCCSRALKTGLKSGSASCRLQYPR